MSIYFKAAERCGMHQVVPVNPQVFLEAAQHAECLHEDISNVWTGQKVLHGGSTSSPEHPATNPAADSTSVNGTSVILHPEALPLREKRAAHSAGLLNRRQKILDAETKDSLDYEQRAKVARLREVQLQEERQRRAAEEQRLRDEEEARREAERSVVVEAQSTLRSRVGKNFLSDSNIAKSRRDFSRQEMNKTLVEFFQAGGEPVNNQLVLI
jgi:hypothetical protein